MQFSDVIGQPEAKKQIQRMLAEQRVPHALLFAGPEGCGKLPMALALAQRLLCQTPTPEGNACGECKNCRMASKLAHPDLHFTFPIIKPAGTSASGAVSDLFIDEWRELIKEKPYFTKQEWLKRMGVENQQAIIAVAEANNIIGKLLNVSSQGGKRVIIMWLAEQMNTEAANKLLKILEEPPHDTHFILTATHTEKCSTPFSAVHSALISAPSLRLTYKRPCSNSADCNPTMHTSLPALQRAVLRRLSTK